MEQIVNLSRIENAYYLAIPNFLVLKSLRPCDLPNSSTEYLFRFYESFLIPFSKGNKLKIFQSDISEFTVLNESLNRVKRLGVFNINNRMTIRESFISDSELSCAIIRIEEYQISIKVILTNPDSDNFEPNGKEKLLILKLNSENKIDCNCYSLDAKSSLVEKQSTLLPVGWCI